MKERKEEKEEEKLKRGLEKGKEESVWSKVNETKTGRKRRRKNLVKTRSGREGSVE